MSDGRIPDYIEHMLQAANDACSYVDGLSYDDFLTDKRTQQAVVMNLIIIGETASKIVTDHPEFASAHSDIPWRSMRGMRNRIAHGYFEIDLKVVWQTVATALPELIQHLTGIHGGNA